MEKKIKTIFLLIIVIFLVSCSDKKSDKTKNIFEVKSFQKLLFDANNGNKKANDSLGTLFESWLSPSTVINHVYIDSIIIPGRGKFYGILIEYPNPIYNRFAIYDTLMNLHLLDKSLNGYLSLQKIPSQELNMFIVGEDFLTKDFIRLKRKNFYQFFSDTTNQTFKAFTFYEDKNIQLEQTIDSLSIDTIYTSITIKELPKLKLKNEIKDIKYFFESSQYRFRSGSNYFDSLVTTLIESKNHKTTLPAITDENSAARSVEKNDSISVNDFNNYTNDKENFSIYLPEGWRVIRNVIVSKNLKMQSKGTHFIHPSYGASFSVIALSENDKAENHFEHPLTNQVEGKYLVRFSDKIVVKKNYFQFFEISCEKKKFIVIFECPINSYENNKKLFESMINSFGINC